MFDSIAANMLKLKIERRVNVKFIAKLNKTAAELYRMLSEDYGKECLLRDRVFNSINGFAVEEWRT